MKLPAPAKVNLHLRILGRLPDGFHEIETLMVLISLADEVTVEVSDGQGVSLTCNWPDVPLGPDNLVTKAVRQFAQETGREFAVRIHLQKRIPMGAGLAGGSSNAAAVLMALNALLKTGLEPRQLEEMASRLGSDVPFFIQGKSALCRGRGERIEPHEIPEKLPLLLIKPPFGIETPWAYRRWREAGLISSVAELRQDLGWATVFNSLEKPAFEKFLLLPVMKRWLFERPEVRVAAMSGSGSTLFAILTSADAAGSLEQAVREAFGESLWTAPCETLSGPDAGGFPR